MMISPFRKQMESKVLCLLGLIIWLDQAHPRACQAFGPVSQLTTSASSYRWKFSTAETSSKTRIACGSRERVTWTGRCRRYRPSPKRLCIATCSTTNLEMDNDVDLGLLGDQHGDTFASTEGEMEEEEEGGAWDVDEEDDDDNDDEGASLFDSVEGRMVDLESVLEQTAHLDPSMAPEGFRTGFVTIVGSPNVGKSTLMNNLVGDRLSIVTPKAGTTRHRIMGICSGPDFQLVYQDTPGVLTPAYKLHEGMMSFVSEAVRDADVLLFVTDIFEESFPTQKVLERLLSSDKTLVVAVNKVDLLGNAAGVREDGTEEPARPNRLSKTRQQEVGSLKDVLERWRAVFPDAIILPISALEGINTAKLSEELQGHLPEGPPIFADDTLSDRPQRFFASEIIREQMFSLFSQEIPYSSEVRLEGFKDRVSRATIDATIIVSRESQKGMVIGKGGAKIKDIGIKSRLALEQFLGKDVNLRLKVKVDKDWRKKEASLRAYGYIS